MKRRFWLLPTIIACNSIVPIVSCGHGNINLNVVKSNYHKIVVETVPTDNYENMSASEIIEKLEPVQKSGLLDKKYDTYRFKDLNYSSEDRATWPAHLHIERALHIAVAAEKQKDSAKMDIAIKLTYFWLADNFWNSNWWFNTIGVPRDLGNIGIILFDKLSKGGQQRLLEIVHRGSFKYSPSTLTFTGANLFWYGDITLKSALLENDREAIDIMINRVIEEIKEDETEGFQHDGSFFQHGKEIYTGGYGRQASTFLTRIIASFAGSGYTWPKDKLDILVNFIIEGIKYCTHKGQFSYLTMGRALSRQTAAYVDGTGTDLGNVFEYRYLLNLENCPHKEEIADMLDALEKKDRANFEGIKCYPQSAMISMNVGNDVYMSFKGVDNELINSETANSENILGHNFSYGANTCVMETGHEYDDISPYWKYDSLPGITSLPETDFELSHYNDDDFKPRKGEGPYFCGQTEDVAFCMQRTNHMYRDKTIPYDRLYKVDFTVTCFATQYGMVILGAGLDWNKPDTKIITHVEQCFKTGDVNITTSKVTHGNVVYKNLGENTTFAAEVSNVEGNWHRNKTSYVDSQEEKRDLLFIAIKTDQSKSYAYSIQPTKQKDHNFVVASNTKSIQAIDLGDGRLAVACYDPGSFTYAGKPYNIKTAGYSIINK